MLFATEVFIALYAHDKIIRPYIGDVLVVILIYCFVRAFIKASVNVVALATLVFSYLVETMQYFKLVNLLGLQDSKLANIVIGNSFSWMDFVCCTIGIAIVFLIDHSRET
ncbi:MAG: DUF2809 domain-containing protein [Chitinophagaceae bacterium]